jgi:hypothetical protein
MMVVWSIRRKYQRTNMRKNHHHPLGWMMMMMTDHTHKRLFSVFLSLPCEQRIFFPFLRIFSLQRRDERERWMRIVPFFPFSTPSPLILAGSAGYGMDEPRIL